ncbi:MAG: class I SAM-dependent methyltransferase [Polyangia bacterium]|nr:class I SAM-dependent methyltransferase [Polyangia bacterium]
MNIREILDDVYQDNVKQAAWGRKRTLDTSLSIDRKTAEYLYRLVLELRPRRCIEIGMAWGFSSVPICAALRDGSNGRSLILDPFQRSTYGDVGRILLGRFGLNRWARFVPERSDVHLPKLFARGHETDFGFIDGDHRADATFVDFYYINKMLRVGGHLVFDDFQFASVRSVVQYALKTFHYVSVAQDNKRLAVLRRTGADDRGWGAYGEL